MLFGQNQVVDALQSLFAIRQIVLYSWLCIEIALYANLFCYRPSCFVHLHLVQPWHKKGAGDGNRTRVFSLGS